MVAFEYLKDKDGLLQLIAEGTHEDLHLDFKASGALNTSDREKIEISKDVSSFANSDGGTIIYGLVEAEHKADRLDDGTSAVDKEWLENVITSNISPRIDGIVIHPVELAAGSYGFIVHVPKSNRAPHQAKDKKFYKRFNFKSVPMEQYEILDVINRVQSPDLQLKFDFIKGDNLSFIAGREQSLDTRLRVVVINNSEVPCEYANVRIFIHSALSVTGPSKGYVITNEINLTISGVEIEFQRLQRHLVTPHTPPIWKGDEFELYEDPIVLNFPHIPRGASLPIVYEITAPHMATKRGYIGVHFGRRSAKLSEEFDNEADLAQNIAL